MSKDRLTRITTGTGDQGKSSLADGTRLPKDDACFEAMGTVDELNATIGLLLACTDDLPETVAPLFRQIQNDLFDLGGELAIPGTTAITPTHWQRLETTSENLNAGLTPLKEFILPGGSELLARCHLVRTVARRAERRLVSLAQQSDVNPDSLIYLNRLSDFCFIAARIVAKENSTPEIFWVRQTGD